MHLAGTKIIIQAKGVDSRCTSTWMLLDMRGQVRNQHVAGGGGGVLTYVSMSISYH